VAQVGARVVAQGNDAGSNSRAAIHFKVRSVDYRPPDLDPSIGMRSLRSRRLRVSHSSNIQEDRATSISILEIFNALFFSFRGEVQIT